nr:hypothetical protein GCM10020241_54710 [Streptoalloteichus tenebrarius]
MQVQSVDLVEGDPVDVRLDLVHREEVPRDVEHRGAVREPRIVEHLTGRHAPRTALRPVALHLRRQQLAERLHTGEQPGRLVGPQHHRPPRDVELVALLPDPGVRAAQP